jgi:CDP-diacylglycerol--glycerol-3-phosphate 3-phosphatidyltransferase
MQTETRTGTENPSKSSFRLLPQGLLARLKDWTAKPLALCAKVKISPNVLTFAGLLAGLASGALFLLDRPVWAGVAIIVCGLLDILDGQVAVQTGRQSKFGAIWDSTLDRYSEFFIYFGLAVHFRGSWRLWIPFWTFLGSVMVSYTRARAEGLGFECREGFMQRAERLVLLSLAAFIGPPLRIFDTAMTAVLILIALVSNVTAVQRTLLVKKWESRAHSLKKKVEDRPSQVSEKEQP